MFHTKILNAHVSYTDVYVIPYFPPNTKVSVHVSNTTPHTPRSVFMFHTDILLHTHKEQVSVQVSNTIQHTPRSVFIFQTLLHTHQEQVSVHISNTTPHTPRTGQCSGFKHYSTYTKNRSEFRFQTKTLNTPYEQVSVQVSCRDTLLLTRYEQVSVHISYRATLLLTH